MRPELPFLPIRQPSDPAMAGTLRLWHAREAWVTDDPAILRRLADGLRHLSDEHRADDCRSQEPIRSYSHAHQLMAAHADHTCIRYTTAAAYTTGKRS
ncbi:hypothetical protein IU448_23485 [Nocardia flavorosea]|uniref:hypothetical protein n=1 Tax=Nocardia flavorosea TaxID=53429 RepID=UPI0018930431|nr:hypothetical protein [Nocardia flavorosea]MBF6351955.1 hypothetical protein [Nocardia flavorosea]